jgi:hypothetical protein
MTEDSGPQVSESPSQKTEEQRVEESEITPMMPCSVCARPKSTDDRPTPINHPIQASVFVSST